MRKLLGVAALVMLMIFPARAGQPTVPDYVAAQVPSAAVVGQGRMTYMMWDLYDAVLYAPQGLWHDGQPMALSLTYLRDLDGRKIADKSAEQIRNQGFSDEIRLAEWQNQMSRIFPDVHKGTNLTGVLDAKSETVFYLNGGEIGRIKDPDFGHRFFAIWLNRNTSDPDLRAELLDLQPQRN